MNKGKLKNNTKLRRKGSMIQDSLSKIKCLFVLALLLVLPVQAMAGGGFGGGGGLLPINQTDTGVDRLVYYWDAEDRDTFFQLTNTSTSILGVHVQVFNVNSPFVVCEEFNWDDVYTPGDTHVYDIENLVSNCTADGLTLAGCDAAPNPDVAGSYGFVVISRTSGEYYSMIGMFRIIDGPGEYEYRTNAAGEEMLEKGYIIKDGFIEPTEDDLDGKPGKGKRNRFGTFDYVLNFNDVDGNNLSDVIGITYVEVDYDTVYSSPGIRTRFGDISGDPFPPSSQVFIFDEFEDPTSCSPTIFACDEGSFLPDGFQVAHLNRGIDNSIPSSKGLANRICNDSTLSDTNDAGWLYLPFERFECFDPFVGGGPEGKCRRWDPYFVGFLGLNNGNGTGSMDSWLAGQERRLRRRPHQAPMTTDAP